MSGDPRYLPEIDPVTGLPIAPAIAESADSGGAPTDPLTEHTGRKILLVLNRINNSLVALSGQGTVLETDE